MELERVTIINSHIDQYGTVWDNTKCDLCDIKKSETKGSFISWPAEHDDSCIRTTVCMNCLAALRLLRMTEAVVMPEVKNKDISECKIGNK
jgi:hypothetical protein